MNIPFDTGSPVTCIAKQKIRCDVKTTLEAVNTIVNFYRKGKCTTEYCTFQKITGNKLETANFM